VDARAVLGTAFGPDLPTVTVDDLPGDRQAQAGSALLAGIGGIDLVEALEDRVELIRRDAAAWPGLENLIALASKLVSVCTIRSASAFT